MFDETIQSIKEELDKFLLSILDASVRLMQEAAKEVAAKYPQRSTNCLAELEAMGGDYQMKQRCLFLRYGAEKEVVLMDDLTLREIFLKLDRFVREVRYHHLSKLKRQYLQSVGPSFRHQLQEEIKSMLSQEGEIDFWGVFHRILLLMKGANLRCEHNVLHEDACGFNLCDADEKLFYPYNASGLTDLYLFVIEHGTSA